MFDNYIDELWGKLTEMELDEVLEGQDQHNSNPQKGYEKYLDGLDLSDMHEHQQEIYLESLWGELDENAISELYEDRLEQLKAQRLARELDQSLAVKGEDPPKIKI